MDAEQQKLIDAYASKHNCDILLFSGGLYPPSDGELVNLVSKIRRRENVVLYLTTLGGSADSAYRIARALKQSYHEGTFTLFVNSRCKSAGTLIAVGADRIVLSDHAELGPLDVQVKHREEVFEMTSGLTAIQALNTLRSQAYEAFRTFFVESRFPFSTRDATEIATQLSVGLFRPIYEQIDPMRLAENQRSLMVAQEYGNRLASRNCCDGSLAKLIGAYPSHSFVIDRSEAAKLFMEVHSFDDTETMMLEMLQPLVDNGIQREETSSPAIVCCVSTPLDSTIETESETHDNGSDSAGTGRTSEEAGEPESGSDPGNREQESDHSDEHPHSTKVPLHN